MDDLSLHARLHGPRTGAPVLRCAPTGYTIRAMSTWSVALTTGLVTGSFTLTAAVLPRLVDSKADKACRADEKAERRRDEKKAAFAAYLAAAAELVSTVPELRRALAATFGLMGAPFDETSAFGEHMETIRTLMAADLAAE